MIVPTFLIIPPALAALNVFMWMYWRRDPDNRVTDLRFLLGVACAIVMMGHMLVIVQRYDQHVTSIVFSVAAFGLLILSIRMLRVLNAQKMPGRK